jgi:MarR family transcriptional regulator, organic hydroperoxide resistance regulator
VTWIAATASDTVLAMPSSLKARSSAEPESDPVLEFLRLMWAVDHELHRVSKAMIGRLGLTAPQRLAVRFIGRQPGLTPGRLAELLHLDPGTVSGIVKRLETSGLVSRVRSGGDTRRMLLTLTAKGRTLNRRRSGTVEAAVRRTLDGISSADLAASSRLLRRLATKLAAESRV